MKFIYKRASLFLQHAHALHLIIPHPSERPMLHAYRGLRCLATGLVALSVLMFVVQAQAECITRTTNSVECTEDDTSTTNIEIDVVDVDIDLSADRISGVSATHAGSGNIDIEVRSSTPSTRSTIDTSGNSSHGFNAEHTGTGNIKIDVRNADVTPAGSQSHGVYSKHTGDGDIDIILNNVIIDINHTVTTVPNGINIEHDGNGDIDIQVKDTTSNSGFVSKHRGVGTSTVRLENTTIDTPLGNSSGIRNDFPSVVGDPIKNGPTHSRTYVTDSEITVRGDYSPGIEGTVSYLSIEGDVLIEVDNSIITTTNDLSSFAINARNQATVGDVSVTVRDSEVHSTYTGIRAMRDGTETGTGRGAVRVDIRNTEISTTANSRYGVEVRNESADATANDVQRTFVQDSTITTSGYLGFGIYSARRGDGDNVIETQNTDIVTKATEHPTRV